MQGVDIDRIHGSTASGTNISDETCPVCLSVEIESVDTDCKKNKIICYSTCKDCSATWGCVYLLKRINNIVKVPSK